MPWAYHSADAGQAYCLGNSAFPAVFITKYSILPFASKLLHSVAELYNIIC